MWKVLSYSNRAGFCVLWLLCHCLSPLICTFGSILTEIWARNILRFKVGIGGHWKDVADHLPLFGCAKTSQHFSGAKKNQSSFFFFFNLPSCQLITGEMAVPIVFPGRVKIQFFWLKMVAIIHSFAKEHSTILPSSGY